jgi:hypothetical protein
MNREYFFGKMEASLVRSDRPAGPPRGVPDRGRIVKLSVGRGMDSSACRTTAKSTSTVPTFRMERRSTIFRSATWSHSSG